MKDSVFKQNPFLVLGVQPGAKAMDIERAAQRLLAMLEIGATSAQIYSSPWGDQPRDAELVRQALAELRQPHVRLKAALLYSEEGSEVSDPGAQRDEETAPRPKDCFAMVNWRGRCTSPD